MTQKYIMWVDKKGIPFMSLHNGKFTCTLKGLPNGSSLSYIYYMNANLTSVSFPKLTTISGDNTLAYTFYGCTNLTSVSFPKLTTISGSNTLTCTFDGCTNLTSVSFPKLTTVTYPDFAFSRTGSSTLTIHLPKALSSLGITNNYGSNSSSYCSFVYDL